MGNSVFPYFLYGAWFVHLEFWGKGDLTWLFVFSKLGGFNNQWNTLQGTNVSHLGKREMIFKYALSGGYVNFLEGILSLFQAQIFPAKGSFMSFPMLPFQKNVWNSVSGWIPQTHTGLEAKLADWKGLQNRSHRLKPVRVQEGAP